MEKAFVKQKINQKEKAPQGLAEDSCKFIAVEKMTA